MKTAIDYETDGSRTVTVDNGDGTGTRTVYNPAGQQVSTEAFSPPLPRNEDVIRARLVQVLEDAAAAQQTLQAQRDAAPVSFTTISQAQTAVRGIQSAVQAQAQIEQQVIKRLVAVARLVVGALDSTDNT